MTTIKDFWDSQATKYGTSYQASWKDKFAIDLEVDLISRYLTKSDKVLDVGCANGSSTIRQANLVKEITGIDFSESMIVKANENKNIINAQGKFNKILSIKFQIGSVLYLPFEDESFDVTYTTRCLINLPTWEDQMKGIKECIRVTKRKGLVILLEAFYEPLVRLNAIRTILNLEPLVEHDFNRYL